MLFENQGFYVIPFGVDFKTSNKETLGIIELLPNANSLALSELGLRELLGRFFYYLKY